MIEGKQVTGVTVVKLNTAGGKAAHGGIILSWLVYTMSLHIIINTLVS